MNFKEYVAHDALGLAQELAKGEVSPLELMETAIARAEEINPRLNALCFADYDHGIDLARRAQLKGRFGALPFLLKDSGLAYEGLAGAMGSRLFAGMKSPANATLTERFLADGLLPFARTTVPEFSMAPTTEAAQNGAPTRNPWDESRSSGGSSGGAAVAVATGIVPLAHGSDGGGSIRIPASCCGIFGLKPSRGLIPMGPSRGEGWGGLASDGVLSRSVRDTAAALDGIAGIDIGAPYAAPPRPGSYLAEMDRPFDRPLRIAKWSSAFEDIPFSPESHAALAHAETLLQALGHEVIDAPLAPIAFEKFLNAQIEVMCANVTSTVNAKVRHRSDTDWHSQLEPAILDAYEIGKTISAEQYVLAITRFHTIARQMESYIQEYDFILTPTLLAPPVPLGSLSTAGDFRSFRHKASRYATFLAIINASGQPAVSLPLYRTEGNLPIGVQLIGHFGGELDLLRISGQLEEANPWAHLLPAL